MTSRKNWPISVSTCFSEPGPKLYKELRENDIHHIELSFSHIEDVQKIDFVHSADKLVREMQEYDVSPASIHLPFSPFESMDPTTPDTDKQNEIIRIQSEILLSAAEVGIPTAVLHPSGEPYRAFDRGDRMKCTAEVLHRIADLAEGCGIQLAIENLPRTCLCNRYEEVLLLLHEIPYLSACFDTNHSLQQPNPDFIRKLGSKISALHISDYDMIDERHLLPFLGRNHWDEIMSALEESDYNGFFTFEVPSKGVLSIRNIVLAYNKLMEI